MKYRVDQGNSVFPSIIQVNQTHVRVYWDQGTEQHEGMDGKTVTIHTGKFIEVMANRLGLTIEELFELAEIGNPISISSLCTVFAESEVINYMGEGRSREDLAAGVIDSVALKVATLVQRKELQDTIIITGGFSNNEFFASLLSKKLGKKALAMPDGRYAGAYGAALLAPVVLKRHDYVLKEHEEASPSEGPLLNAREKRPRSQVYPR